uniref:Uncharacterized protein n=1 Tax=Anguilla anguilla TaxID=7936 RepID=A0A0E9WJG8_ANGAN
MTSLKFSRSSWSGKRISHVFGRLSSLISFCIRSWAALAFLPPAPVLFPPADSSSFFCCLREKSLIIFNYFTLYFTPFPRKSYLFV